MVATRVHIHNGALIAQLYIAHLQTRFTIDDSTQPARIRANQGHSYEVQELELQPITQASQVPFAVHVTGKQGCDSGFAF